MKRFLLSAVLLPAVLFGAEVSTDDAARAAATWVDLGYAMGRMPAGRAVAGVDELEDPETGARLRVARFKGGGFVVLSADDLVDPVIAFSATGDGIVPDERNPFWALLRADVAAREAAAGVVRGAEADGAAESAAAPKRAAAGRAAAGPREQWAALVAGRRPDGGASPGIKRAAQGVASVSDVRVEPFVETRWNQETATPGNQDTADEDLCYNYYTPENYACGCVATLLAQLMRYWRFPTGSVPRNTYPCKVEGRAVNKKMMGGTYAWDDMPADPANGVVEKQRKAIGKICYDAGVTVEMEWDDHLSTSSLYAGGACLPIDFGYANAKVVNYGNDYTLDHFMQCVVPNLDARCPVGVSVVGAGGHTALADGYGFSGSDFYVHLNMGWSGLDDAWYHPPNLGTTLYPFNAVKGLLFNVFPTNTGSVASGRVLDAAGAPVAGAAVALANGSKTVGTAVSDGNGIYAFIAPEGKTYVATASKDGFSGSREIVVGQTTGTTIVTAAGNRGAFFSGKGTVGNSWGNDIELEGYEPLQPPERGTLQWYATRSGAAAAARSSGKRILLVSGRATCSDTEYTRFEACEADAVRELLRDGYVLWYNDRDAFGGDFGPYAAGLPAGHATPLVCVLEPDASTNCLSRTTGRRTAAQLRAVLDDAVLFDANGGTVDESVRYLAPGSAYGTLPEPLRQGYSSDGWFLSAEGGDAVSEDDVAPDGVSTLFARWTAQTFRVTLNRAPGSGGSSRTTATYGSPMPAVSVPTREGYSFDGYWSRSGGTGTRYYTAAGKSARNWDVAANATLYAKWTAKRYAVTLDPEGGTGGTASVTATFGSAMPAIQVPVLDGLFFSGYFAEPDGGGVQYYTAAGTSACAWDVPEAATLHAYWTEAVPSSVHRFYSKAYKGHFFTISEEEKEDIRLHNKNWKYEGEAYRAFAEEAPETTALYRFYSKGYRGHFFTVDAVEAETVKLNRNWKYEGIAYYVYPSAVAGSVPVFRFWSKSYRHHFYTTNESERDELDAHNPNWKYEGVAFYALPALNASAKAKAAPAAAPSGERGTGASRAAHAAAWTLAAADGTAVAVPGVTAAGDVLVEAREEAPDADELGTWNLRTFESSDPTSASLRLSLPDGAFDAALWSAAEGPVAGEAAEGAFDFALPATGVWHWLRARDGDGEDAFSVWLRAE